MLKRDNWKMGKLLIESNLQIENGTNGITSDHEKVWTECGRDED